MVENSSTKLNKVTNEGNINRMQTDGDGLVFCFSIFHNGDSGIPMKGKTTLPRGG
jgi:hypothetical protein